MKRIYSLLAFILCVSVLSSCDDFMDVHKEYIEDGEIIYAPKPDTISFVAGKERILFHCRTYNAPNVKSVDIYWNDGLDSLIIPVSLGAGYDSLNVVLDNMPEKSYTFNVHTTDHFGHVSLSVTNFGSSYGSSYQSTLNDRRIKAISLLDTGGVIDWYSSMEGLVRNEVRYTRKDGTEALACLPAGEYSVTCPDVQSGSTFEYRSLYIPEEEAIDTFATAWKTYEDAFPLVYKFDRSNWTVLAVSDETASDGGGKDAIIDDKLDTWWHSNYTDEDTPLPHWAVIDMGSPKKMSKIEIYRRSGTTDTKSVEIYVGNSPDADATDWVQVATGTFGNGDSLELPVPASIDTNQGRYMKILLPDSNREPFTNIAEVYIYGK